MLPFQKSGIYACISSRITTVIQVVRYYQINYNWYNEPFAVSQYNCLYLDMHGLIFDFSVWLLAGSTRLILSFPKCTSISAKHLCKALISALVSILGQLISEKYNGSAFLPENRQKPLFGFPYDYLPRTAFANIPIYNRKMHQHDLWCTGSQFDRKTAEKRSAKAIIYLLFLKEKQYNLTTHDRCEHRYKK